MSRFALLVSLAITIPGCCRFCKSTPTADSHCGFTPEVSLAPGGPSQAVKDLRTAAEVENPGDLEGEFLASHCSTKWQNIIETTHCHAAVATHCQARCTTDAARKDCLEGPSHEDALDRCRAQSLPVFQVAYPACGEFTLCGNKLLPPGAPCQAP